MSNPVAEQLATLRTALEGAGWTQTSAGRWRLNDTGWTLTTGYVWGEGTITLARDRRTQPRGTQRAYRGAHPLTWAKTEAHPVLRKIFEVGLDKPADAP